MQRCFLMKYVTCLQRDVSKTVKYHYLLTKLTKVISAPTTFAIPSAVSGD